MNFERPVGPRHDQPARALARTLPGRHEIGPGPSRRKQSGRGLELAARSTATQVDRAFRRPCALANRMASCSEGVRLRANSGMEAAMGLASGVGSPRWSDTDVIRNAYECRVASARGFRRCTPSPKHKSAPEGRLGKQLILLKKMARPKRFELLTPRFVVG